MIAPDLRQNLAVVHQLGLKRAGCGNVQGYLFSKPVAADDIAALLGAEPEPLRQPG
jgi:predicted signal transduction protein with EAL and GGDEF domain